MQRRRLLSLGVISAAALAVGGGTLAMLKPGLHEARLSPAGREVFAGASRGILDGTLPSGDAQLTAIEGLLTRIDALVAGLPPHAQSELSQLLSLLASSGGRRALCGLEASWPVASVADIQQALQLMRHSRLSLRQQAYHALHDIVGSAWFSDAQTWSALGYPGPLKI